MTEIFGGKITRVDDTGIDVETCLGHLWRIRKCEIKEIVREHQPDPYLMLSVGDEIQWLYNDESYEITILDEVEVDSTTEDATKGGEQ